MKSVALPYFVKNALILIFSAAFLFSTGNGFAQTAPQNQTPENKPAATAPESKDSTAADSSVAAAQIKQDDVRRYRIGVGDELDVQVFRHPELSQTVRVNELGVILMPRIDQPVQAACKTENELSVEIVEQYKKYLRQPFVRVFVKEYKSQPVSVIGAVDKPGQFNVNRRMRLLEAVAVAGGPTDKAGSKIILARLGRADVCASPTTETQEQDLSKLLFSFDLNKTLQGGETANPWMQPGDIVTVLETDQAFVVGNVKEPKAIDLKKPYTVMQAIAAAGGILPASKKKEIFLIRDDGNGNKVKTPINYDAISKSKAEDPLLKPNDIVEIPVDGAKAARNSVMRAITGGLSNLPILIF